MTDMDPKFLEQQGLDLYQAGEWDQALASFEEARAAYAAQGDPSGVVEMWNNVGIVRYRQRDWEKAEVAFLQAPNPILIAMGNDAYRLLQDHFQVEYRIYKVPHYSPRSGKLVDKENYRQAVFKELKGLIAEVGAG